MQIQKTWAMPNARTFEIKPIKKMVEKTIRSAQTIIDPFAGHSRYGTITNDLNPDCGTTECMDALDFLKKQPDGSADVVLFDPPYSITQAATEYKSYGRDKLEVNVANMMYWAMCKDHVARILKVGGKCFIAGWNTNGLGKKRGFEMVELLIVNHGGSRNDTLCTVEIKRETVPLKRLEKNGNTHESPPAENGIQGT